MADMWSPTGTEFLGPPHPDHQQPSSNRQTNAPNAAQPYNDARIVYDRRYQAYHYQSDRYPEGLTPEWVNKHKKNQRIENGQVHEQYQRWTPFDTWGMTNNWFHRMGDRVPYCKFTGWRLGLHSAEFYDQPYEGHLCYSKRPYNDNIVAQTMGGMIAGAQIGIFFGFANTFNVSREANIYQTMFMPPNRWLPMSKATGKFRRRVFMGCVVQAATFLGGYQFIEGSLSKLRSTDDFWNQLIGGAGAGCLLYGWFRSPVATTTWGFIFGFHMAVLRYRVAEWTPKLAFDPERPLYGVFGGWNNWFYGLEPDEYKKLGGLSIPSLMDSKYK